MYLRMLKRDLKDKKALNTVLFVLMIMASIFMGTGLIILYTNIFGLKDTYKKCNTADIGYLMLRDISDEGANDKRMEEILKTLPNVEGVAKSDVVLIKDDRLEFEHYDPLDNDWVSWQDFAVGKVPDTYNRPLDGNYEYFTVDDGYVAIAQHVANLTNSEVGDYLRITTDYGNKYEFIISDIYTNPSSEGLDMIYLSDHDGDIILSECPSRRDLYEVKISGVDGDYYEVLSKVATAPLANYEEVNISLFASKMMDQTNDGMISTIVSIILIGVAIFMMLMILVTINFSLRSTIKQEEKEIGIMKAIGVYSFSYRTLFAVKYIAFAIVGGLIGLPFAAVFSHMLIGRFVFHTIPPKTGTRVILLLAALLFTLFFIVGFTLLSLRRMNKISVMDAIHGENRGERFGKLSGLFLHKKKRISIPLFLALSDILKKVKRYIYLIIAYVCGACMILTVIMIKDSICSKDYFMKYWQQGQMDFEAIPEVEYLDKLANKAGNYKAGIELINKNFEEHGIPAEIEYCAAQGAAYYIDGQERTCYLMFDLKDASEVVLVKGNSPMLRNEIAIPYRLAMDNGLNIGDSITIKYEKYNMNHVTTSKVTEDFVITGFFEGFGLQLPKMLLSSQIDNVVPNYGYHEFSYKLNCDPRDYDRYYKMMDDLYTDDEIRFIRSEDVEEYEMGSYIALLNAMLLIVSIVVVIVVTMLTCMYETIFIDEEVADVALLKSMGFERKTVRSWHRLRMVILSIASGLASVLIMVTLIKSLLERAIVSFIRTYTFDVPVRGIHFVVVPLLIVALVTIVVIPALKPMDKIQIWRVNNE